ncbi:MAG: hypothetical protein A2133_05975 [Actinobacteria bacterium RBG_16_64_13]|nr:MAG: hypothetical protein A2133_05975 [Actinobacteria bacterium RBG_16_64_13]
MAERHVYNEAEKRMLEAEAKRFEGMAGWYQPKRPMVATEESIRRMGLGVDPWNPLWHDETYARGTRWGTILAYPTYLGFFGETGIRELRAPAECGRQYMIWMGEDYEFHRPVRPGDSFRIHQNRPEIFDVTPPGDQSPRVYGLLEGDLEYFDQDDQPIGRLRNYVQRTFQSVGPTIHPMPEYSYTAEEIRYLGRLMKEEEVRGAATLYWEEVQVGDEPKPIVTGPTNMGTNAMTSAIIPDLGDFFMHARHFYLDSLGDTLGPEFIHDAVKGRYMIRGGLMSRHWSDLAAQAEGEPCAWLFGVVSRFSLLRVLTNWMGDDGVLRRFKWRHMTRTRVGDAIVAQAKVTGRRIEEGEHLVDLHVWLRNLRGNVSEAAVATVMLPSREPATAGPSLVAQCVAAGTRVGDQVRIKAQPEWPTPPGFRFAGAEGTVIKWVEYDEAMAGFADSVVCVRLDRAHGEGQAYTGGSLLFRVEDVQRA